jgi:hypothetical protein
LRGKEFGNKKEEGETIEKKIRAELFYREKV